MFWFQVTTFRQVCSHPSSHYHHEPGEFPPENSLLLRHDSVLLPFPAPPDVHQQVISDVMLLRVPRGSLLCGKASRALLPAPALLVPVGVPMRIKGGSHQRRQSRPVYISYLFMEINPYP